MRRLVALILLLIVPLQFAWSAVAGVHGHMGADIAAMGVHSHVHDHDEHQDSKHPDHDVSLTDNLDQGHGEDGHHASHYHPVFSSILMEHSLALSPGLASGPILFDPTVFLSRVPPPLDRPPLAFA